MKQAGEDIREQSLQLTRTSESTTEKESGVVCRSPMTSSLSGSKLTLRGTLPWRIKEQELRRDANIWNRNHLKKDASEQCKHELRGRRTLLEEGRFLVYERREGIESEGRRGQLKSKRR